MMVFGVTNFIAVELFTAIVGVGAGGSDLTSVEAGGHGNGFKTGARLKLVTHRRVRKVQIIGYLAIVVRVISRKISHGLNRTGARIHNNHTPRLRLYILNALLKELFGLGLDIAIER